MRSGRGASRRSPVAWGKECTGILAHRHPFFRQLLFRAFVLGQLLQAHAAQNVWSLGELDIVIAHNLDAIAPGVAEIEKRTADRLDPRHLEGGARRLLVIDNEADMTAVIGGLFASRLQRDELVAKIDEGHRPALATQLKVEDAAVECQRLLDIPDFQRYMVQADGARLCGANHSTLLLSVAAYLVRTAQSRNRDPCGSRSHTPHCAIPGNRRRSPVPY